MPSFIIKFSYLCFLHVSLIIYIRTELAERTGCRSNKVKTSVVVFPIEVIIRTGSDVNRITLAVILIGPTTVYRTGITWRQSVTAVNWSVGDVVVSELPERHLHVSVKRLKRLIRSHYIRNCSRVWKLGAVVCQSGSRNPIGVVGRQKSDMTRVRLPPIRVMQVIARPIDGPVLASGSVVTLKSPALSGTITRVTTCICVSVASHVLMSNRNGW